MPHTADAGVEAERDRYSGHVTLLGRASEALLGAHDPDEAEMSRRHNDANVLTLAGNRLGPEDATPIVDRFLETGFDGGRHARRVDKIAALENGAPVD